MREGLQYYHRYLSAFHLERYDLVARDTARNLRLFAFVVKHAARQRDRIEFDRYRPYVEMMHYRARASQALAPGRLPRRAGHIDDGIEAIRRFLAEYGQEEHEAECSELPVPPPVAPGGRTRAADRAARAAGAAARGLGDARGLRGGGAAPRPDPAAPGRPIPASIGRSAPPDRSSVTPLVARSQRSQMPS